MTLSRAVDVLPPRVRSIEARAWGMALLVAAMWFDVLYGAARQASTLSLPAWLAALAGVLTQIAFTACEAAVAVQAWRVAGKDVRWRALTPRLLAVSSLEALAVAIAAGHTTLSPGLVVWLAGIRAVRDGPTGSGLAFAFAAFGLLTTARLVLSAHVQSGAARASFARALLVVLTLYLATRLAMWWSFDLMQGRSFQRWG
jgi:hypothetical protein